MSQMRVPKGANFGDFMSIQQKKGDQTPNIQFKANHGFKLGVNKPPQIQQIKINQQQQQQTPINLLLNSNPSSETIKKSQEEIKIVSSIVVVPEDPPSDLIREASDKNIANTLLEEKKAKINRQEQYVQTLFINLPRQNNEPFLGIIQNNQRQSPQEKILSFFKFLQIVTKMAKNKELLTPLSINQKVEQFQKHICTQIISLKKQGCKELNLNTFPQIFAMILTESSENHIDKLLQQNQIQKALAITQLSDKAFLDFPSKYASNHFKLQLNCLRQQNLQFLKRSCWLLQIAVVTNIFEKNLFEYGQQIIKRELQFQKHILLPQFILFFVQWRKLSTLGKLQNRQNLNVGQQQIIKIINQAIGIEYQQLWQLHTILIAQVDMYPRAFNLIVQKIIRKIKKPQTFLQLLACLQFEDKQITPLFNIYINENENIKNNPQIVDNLKISILQGLGLINKTRKVAQKLTEWVYLTQLKNLQSKKNYEQFLVKLVMYYEKLSKSDLVNFDHLLKSMRQIVTDFRICCNYKSCRRNKTYKLLADLERKIEKKQYVDIIQGCKSFLQLKQGVFTLNEKEKLKNIHYFYTYIQKQETKNDQMKKQNVIRVLKNIQDALLQMLQTNAGRIYLSQISNQLEKQKETLFKPDGQDKLLKSQGTSFSILMQILGQNTKIKNYMALLIGFR